MENQESSPPIRISSQPYILLNPLPLSQASTTDMLNGASIPNGTPVPNDIMDERL